LTAKLVPTYAEAHQLEDEEASTRIQTALQGALLEDLLAGIWATMVGSTQRLDDEGLVEKVAKTLRDRPMRQGKVVALTPGWSAFFLRIDLAAGTASDAARKVMETDAGRQASTKGLEEVASHLAKELTKGR
jgi:hypothetical protein